MLLYLRPIQTAVDVCQQNSIEPVDADRTQQSLHVALKLLYCFNNIILQGLRVAQAAVSERWPQKVEKTAKKSVFFRKKINITLQKYIFFYIYLLVMPKYWGKQIFAHRRFPEVGHKQKTEKRKKREERKRPKVGDNNGQATHGARKLGARKPPGPK